MNLHSQLPREPKARTSPSPEQSVSLTSAPNVVCTEQLPWLCPTRKKQMFPLLLHILLFCSEKKTVHPVRPSKDSAPRSSPLPRPPHPSPAGTGRQNAAHGEHRLDTAKQRGSGAGARQPPFPGDSPDLATCRGSGPPPAPKRGARQRG